MKYEKWITYTDDTHSRESNEAFEAIINYDEVVPWAVETIFHENRGCFTEETVDEIYKNLGGDSCNWQDYVVERAGYDVALA